MLHCIHSESCKMLKILCIMNESPTELVLLFHQEMWPSDMQSSHLKATDRNSGSNKMSHSLSWSGFVTHCIARGWGMEERCLFGCFWPLQLAWPDSQQVSLWLYIFLGAEICWRVKLLQVSSTVLRNTYYTFLIWWDMMVFSGLFIVFKIKKMLLFLKKSHWLVSFLLCSLTLYNVNHFQSPLKFFLKIFFSFPGAA